MNEGDSPLKVNREGYRKFRMVDPMLALLYLKSHLVFGGEQLLVITDDPGDTYEALEIKLIEKASKKVSGVGLKPHVFRECVNQLTETARTYGGTQQLREQMKKTLSQFIDIKP